MNSSNYQEKINYAAKIFQQYPQILSDIDRHIEEMIHILFNKDYSSANPKYVQICREISNALEYTYIDCHESSTLSNIMKIMLVLLNSDVDKFLKAYEYMLNYLVDNDKYNAINMILEHGIITPIKCPKINIIEKDYIKLVMTTHRLLKNVYINEMRMSNNKFVARLILNRRL